MSHETPVVPVEVRDRTGSRYAQRLRKAGRLPGVVYGHKADPVSVSVDAKSMVQMLERGLRVFELESKNGRETVLVKDLQFGYLGDNVTHIDFARVDLTEEVEVNVAIHFVGEPAEASKPGAVVQFDQAELAIVCQVANIPEEIRVDLSTMEGTSMTAGDIELPENVKLNLDASTSVVSITIVAEEAEGEEVSVGGDGAEPEVIGGGDESKGDDA